MPSLTPLLEIQELDLQANAANKRAEELPERTLIPKLAMQSTAIHARVEALRANLGAIHAEEESVGKEVGEIVREIEAADLERYSGKRKNRDDAHKHDEAQGVLKARKDELEDREMELLESIEAVESEIAAQQTAIEENSAEQSRIMTAIRAVEEEVEIQVESLMATRRDLEVALPTPVLTAYDRVRAQPRAGGRGATTLAEGRCGACRIKLPVHEVAKMLAEGDNAVLQCPQCRRVLIRDST